MSTQAQIDPNSSRMKGSGVLKRSLSLLYVYALATGSILTFIGYWDGNFLTLAGPATFLGFAIMTLLILPIAFVYAELASMLPTAGAELVYGTVGLNKHWGFWSSWFILAAWMAVPPAAVMGIIAWINRLFGFGLSIQGVAIIGGIVLIVYTWLSLNDIKLAGQIQTVMLFIALFGVALTAILFFFSGHWSWSNFHPFIRSALNGGGATGNGGYWGWFIGVAALIGPFFGFETVPNLVEEGNFPIKSQSKAIWGSVITCGVLYVLFFFSLAGMDTWEFLTGNGTFMPFSALEVMEKIGWPAFYGVFFGISAILFTIGTCLLGFWLSTVRLLYAMGRQNFLPKVFAKTNKHQQPIAPNILLLVISLASLIVMNTSTFLNDFYMLMSFSVAVSYTIIMASAINLWRKHPEWERPYKLWGGQAFRILALIIALVITWLTTLGQSISSWKAFSIYGIIGAVFWLWMIIYKWQKEPVWMNTPEGEKDY
ncbi:ethanolamine permease [Paradesulfitobacterium aromaticivorans]